MKYHLLLGLCIFMIFMNITQSKIPQSHSNGKNTKWSHSNRQIENLIYIENPLSNTPINVNHFEA